MKALRIRTLLVATFAIGTLDLLFAWGFWATRGVTAVDLLQSIARGWYGNASREMGATSALVGATSHYAIMFAFVLAYAVAARRNARLRRHPWRFGIAYGAFLYLLMNFIVLPLSAAGLPGFDNHAWVIASVAMHLLIGALCALAARRALR